MESLHASFVVTETAVALGMTETAAGRRVDAAVALLVDERLPRTAGLFGVAGVLDWARVNILVMRTRDLSVEQARTVEGLVLTGRGLGLTVGRFENEVDRAVLTVDAAAVERRRAAAKADRKAVFWKVRDGSGTLDGRAELCVTGPAEALLAAWKADRRRGPLVPQARRHPHPGAAAARPGRHRLHHRRAARPAGRPARPTDPRSRGRHRSHGRRRSHGRHKFARTAQVSRTAQVRRTVRIARPATRRPLPTADRRS